jgi:S-adenosyl-L-methionine hydrolase (adenosine-forming)
MITLTTDFGLRDPYVAEMKGAILTINPKAMLIDITHNVEKFNIRMGSFMLASAAPYFPKGTTHLVIVDPGVGTERRGIVVQTKRGFFVGPDNGVLMLAAQSQGIEAIYELSNLNLMFPQTSNTFHGRDIFAPAAAYIDRGTQPRDFGSEIKDPVLPHFSVVEQIRGVLSGEILYIDSFGNVIFNIKEKIMPNSPVISIKLPQVSLKLKFCKTYGEATTGEPIVLVGSDGFVELALNQGSAAEKFNLKVGDKIAIMVD